MIDPTLSRVLTAIVQIAMTAVVIGVFWASVFNTESRAWWLQMFRDAIDGTPDPLDHPDIVIDLTSPVLADDLAERTVVG